MLVGYGEARLHHGQRRTWAGLAEGEQEGPSWVKFYLDLLAGLAWDLDLLDLA